MSLPQKIARRNENVFNSLPALAVDLHINPDAPQAKDDHYRLLNEDGSLHQERTVIDDAIPGDGYLTLIFTGLIPGCKYSLEVDLGAEGRYLSFYKVLLEDLLETASNPSATVQSEEESALPNSFEEAERESDIPDSKPEAQLIRIALREQKDGEPNSPWKEGSTLIL
ncbi:hypothetical protein [Candidatus Contendibacter odensensis]|uniref:Uncharacterized protein n=1 Tax=Candidatus Contendobacter odensis Run_B_J11 TaxID=1400861 RepID=A0A7U7GAW7_9GAMM|nr:hypothetical protein [Candidatus Contendobacter odensis]CDH44893.1 hypothetical protein BN874_20013 [Candidatus Contendobacter odensis Run_B_J11]